MQREAAATFRRLLPGWDVRGIDCTQLIRMGGAVHCVTLNLPDLKPPQNRRPLNVVQQQQPLLPVRANPSGEQDDSPIMFRTENTIGRAVPPAHPFTKDE